MESREQRDKKFRKQMKYILLGAVINFVLAPICPLCMVLAPLILVFGFFWFLGYSSDRAEEERIERAIRESKK